MRRMSHAENMDPEAFLHFVENISIKFRKFVTSFLHDIFRKGEITGDRLLDIGTGPACYSVYAASRWFREITLSDVSEANLDVLRAWKTGKRRDLDSVFNYMIQLDGNREDLKSANQRLSNQVRSIVHCNLRKENLLAGTDAAVVVFDAIILSVCMKGLCFSRDEYKRAIIGYSRHLKQGGHVIVVDVLQGSYFRVGKDTFSGDKFGTEDLKTMYQESGYEIIEWRESDDLYDPYFDENGMTDLRSGFGMVACKR